MSTEPNEIGEICRLLKSIDNRLAQILEKIPDFNAPANAYGENLVDGIQNAIERGQRGISTY